jgi:hypothetical protein
VSRKKVLTPEQAAEQEDYLAQHAEAEERTALVVASLQDTWCAVSGLTWMPADHVLRAMLVNNPPVAVEDAMIVVAPKVASGYLRKSDWVRYTWGVLRTTRTRAAYEREQPARADALLEQAFPEVP